MTTLVKHGDRYYLCERRNCRPLTDEGAVATAKELLTPEKVKK